MEAIRISKSEIKLMIENSFEKNKKKIQLESEIKKVENKIKSLNEEFPPSMPDTIEKTEKRESIFDTRIGDIIIFNFQDATIKAKRLATDLFEIIDASESKKIKEGDFVQIKGNDIIQKGKKFKFSILRKAFDYESNPLESWRIIKN